MITPIYMIAHARNANTAAYKQLTGWRTQPISNQGIKEKHAQKSMIRNREYPTRNGYPLTQHLRHVAHEQAMVFQWPRSYFQTNTECSNNQFCLKMTK